MEVKDYISNWSKNFQFIFQKSQLLSQISVFILAVILSCDIGKILILLSNTNNCWEETKIWLTGGGWLIGIMVGLFWVRFILLFSKSKIHFWITQIIWLLGFIWLFYNSINLPSYNIRFFEIIVFFYLIGSFIRQNISLLLAFFLKKTVAICS